MFHFENLRASYVIFFCSSGASLDSLTIRNAAERRTTPAVAVPNGVAVMSTTHRWLLFATGLVEQDAPPEELLEMTPRATTFVTRSALQSLSPVMGHVQHPLLIHFLMDALSVAYHHMRVT